MVITSGPSEVKIKLACMTETMVVIMHVENMTIKRILSQRSWSIAREWRGTIRSRNSAAKLTVHRQPELGHESAVAAYTPIE